MKRFFFKSLTLLLLAVLLPSQVFAAITINDSAELTGSLSSPFTDIELLPLPKVEDYSSNSAFSAAKEEYYQAFGAHMFTQQLENSFDKLVGYASSDGTHYFAPNNTVNRAEAAKFFQAYSRLNTILVNSGVVDFSAMFNDEIPSWARTYIWVLKDQGIIQGYSDGTYRPDNTLNNAEIFKFLYKTYINGEVSESGYSTWYSGYQDALVSANIIPSGLDPNANPTRGEMAAYMMRGYVMYRTGSAAFSDYQTLLLAEELLFYYANLFPYLYVEGDIQITSATDSGSEDYTNESVTLTNNGSSTVNLGGYILRFNDDDDRDLTLEYVFDSDVNLSAGESLTVYTTQGEYTFGEESESSFGFIDHISGEYRYMLYNPNYELVSLFWFET